MLKNKTLKYSDKSKYIEPFMIYNLNETEKEYTEFQFMKYLKIMNIFY